LRKHVHRLDFLHRIPVSGQFKSRANVAGLPETYISRSGAIVKTATKSRRSHPFRGGLTK